MILLDTNVLVALLNERDSLHGRAVDDLANLARETFFTITPVLAETCFLLPTLNGRRKLHALLHRLLIVPVASDTDEIWQATFDWMIKYAHHEPDWADATLAVLAGRNPHARVWSYDREFQTIWRRPDGSMIPLVIK